MRDVVLHLHVVLGAGGLLLGPAWLVARRRGGAARGLAAAYQGVVAGITLSAGVLAVTGPGLSWLVPIAMAKRRLHAAARSVAPVPA